MQLLNDSAAKNWLRLVVLQAICFVNGILEENSHSSQDLLAPYVVVLGNTAN